MFPLPPRLFAAGVAVQLSLLMAIVQWTSPAPDSPLLFLVVAVGIGGMCMLGG